MSSQTPRINEITMLLRDHFIDEFTAMWTKNKSEETKEIVATAVAALSECYTLSDIFNLVGEYHCDDDDALDEIEAALNIIWMRR